MYKYLSSDASEAEKKQYEKNKIFNTVLGGLLVRLLVLGLILCLFSVFEINPYYISDDETYDRVAERYLDFADSPIDSNALTRCGASKYLSPFWPCFACIVAYVFNGTWAVRFLNIALSCICVIVIYYLVRDISGKDKTALLAAKLYAYMPYAVLVSCFPIKDVFLTLGVLVTLLLFVRLQSGIKVGWFHWIATVLLLWAMSQTRGAVTEFLLMVAGIYICVGLIKKRHYILFVFVLLLMLLFLYVFGQSIIDSFSTKADTYMNYERTDTTISFVRIDSVAQIYKLPVTYSFSQIMPLSTSWFSSISMNAFWSTLISRLNSTAFPIAIGNFLYLFFCKKKNFIFYFTTFTMYSAVIILSLGIYRHYFFLLPLSYINFALYSEEKTVQMSNTVVIGTIVLALAVLLWSL